jgi:hypothetical protein
MCFTREERVPGVALHLRYLYSVGDNVRLFEMTREVLRTGECCLAYREPCVCRRSVIKSYAASSLRGSLTIFKLASLFGVLSCMEFLNHARA